MLCRICNDIFYPQSYYEPEEPCWCGAGWDMSDPLTFKGRLIQAGFSLVSLINQVNYNFNQYLIRQAATL